MTEEFKINYPNSDAGKKEWNRNYGFNAIYSGKFWAKRKEDAQLWHQLTMAAIHAHCIRREPFKKPVEISFSWNDRMDLSNHAYMAKLIEDGMKGTIIVDDSRKWVKGISHRFSNDPFIRVVVREVEDEDA